MTIEKAEEIRKLLYRIERLKDVKKRFSDPSIKTLKIVINPERDMLVLTLKDRDVQDILRYICDGLEIDINECNRKLEEY